MKIIEPEFQHSDARRVLTQLLTQNIKQVNHYKAKMGAVLGDHYHKDTIEYFYVIEGQVDYNNTRLLSNGDLFVVYPEENHSITCITDVELMTFLTKPFEKENPDLWKRQS